MNALGRDRGDCATACRCSSPAMSGWPAPGRAIPGCLTLDALAGARSRPMRSSMTRWSTQRVLALAGRQARLEFAGKRGGKPSATQDDITAAAGRAGARRPARAAAQGRRPLRVRTRRRGGAGAGGGRHSVPRHSRRHRRPWRRSPTAAIPATLRGVNQRRDLRRPAMPPTATTISTGRRSRAPASRSSSTWGCSNLARIAAALMQGGLAGATPAAVIVARDDAERAHPRSRRWQRSPPTPREQSLEPPAIDRRRRHRRRARERLLSRRRRAEAARDDRARPHHRGAALRRRQDRRSRSALLAALRRRGVRGARREMRARTTSIPPSMPRPPARRGVNLDSWAMPPALLDALAARGRARRRPRRDRRRHGPVRRHPRDSRPLAARPPISPRAFGLPVLLVLDVSGQSQTAAAVADGFAAHDPGGAASPASCSTASPANATACSPPTPSRRSAFRSSAPSRAIRRWPCRSAISASCRRSEHADLARADRSPCRHWPSAMSTSTRSDRRAPRRSTFAAPATGIAALPPPGQRIALASDARLQLRLSAPARGWRAGRRRDRAVLAARRRAAAARLRRCWLPGGYPELHAGRPCRGAQIFSPALRRFAATRPVHGECGGYMVLGESLEDAAGGRHAMTGLLGHATSFARRKLHLGYRTGAALVRLPARPRRHGRARP